MFSYHGFTSGRLGSKMCIMVFVISVLLTAMALKVLDGGGRLPATSSPSPSYFVRKSLTHCRQCRVPRDTLQTQRKTASRRIIHETDLELSSNQLLIASDTDWISSDGSWDLLGGHTKVIMAILCGLENLPCCVGRPHWYSLGVGHVNNQQEVVRI